MSIIRTALLIAGLSATSAAAGPVSFSSGWSEQRLSLFSSNDYSFGNQLSMTSNGSVSIAYARVPTSDWQASAASWAWTVDTSVPATDLRQKGGDDRNLSIYFVFLPDDRAEAMQNAGIRELLADSSVRVLLYTWGGNHSRGAAFPSPYLPGQGMNIALRQAGTGSFSENVNLAQDYANAFGGQPGSLVGLAVSGDSDDTSSRISAAIGNMTLN